MCFKRYSISDMLHRPIDLGALLQVPLVNAPLHEEIL